MSIEKSTIRKESITSFFILTFIFTLPAYILIGLTGLNIILSPEMVFAFVPLSVISPICSALFLTYKQNGWISVKKLLKKSIDFKSVKNKIWYGPTLLLMPLLFLLVWGVSNLLGQELLPAPIPFLVAPILLIIFFISALGEEIGWMGYAFEPMQDWWGTTKATLILGLIWALWHLPMYVFALPDSVTIVTQMVSLVALRFLFVWLFLNTGQSLFIAILFHAVYNVCMSVFPINFVITAIIIIIIALVIVYKWILLPPPYGKSS